MQLKRPLCRFFCIYLTVNHAAASVPPSWLIVSPARFASHRQLVKIRQPPAASRQPPATSRWSMLELELDRFQIRRPAGQDPPPCWSRSSHQPPAAGQDPRPAGHVFCLGSLHNRGVLRWPRSRKFKKMTGASGCADVS